MVRLANIEDKLRINELGSLLNKKYEKLFDLETILHEDFSKFYVYDEDGIIKGFLHVTVLYETIDIVNLVVDPEYRRLGIASILIDYMISDASTDVASITLEVAKDNEAAIKLYEKFGFEIIQDRKGYYEGKDAILMGRVMGE